MSTDEWITAFAAAAGTAPPSPAERDGLLELAAVAADAAERAAAPITCWLAAVAGLSAADALALASTIRLGDG